MTQRKFLVTVCPRIRMINGGTSRNYYQYRLEAPNRDKAISMARAKWSQNKAAGETSPTVQCREVE